MMEQKVRNPKEFVVARAVNAELANTRSATAKTKKRGEVSGGGRKPWRQKGTGRARAGSTRSPIWRGGGVAFGPTGVQNFKKQMNQKEKELAKKIAIEAKKSVSKTVNLPKVSKTKEAATFLMQNNAEGKVLLMFRSFEFAELSETKRCFSNIPNVVLKLEKDASTYDILKADHILIITKPEKKQTKAAAVKKDAK